MLHSSEGNSMNLKNKILVALGLVIVSLGGYGYKISSVKHVALTQQMEKATKGPIAPPSDPTEKTKTWCALQCGDVPFVGFKCIMVCMTCSTDFGGGCSISIFPPN